LCEWYQDTEPTSNDVNSHYVSVHPQSDGCLHTEIERLRQTVFQAWKTVNQKSIVTGILIAVIYSFATPAAFSASGGVCMVDRYNGHRFVIGDNLNPAFPGAPKSSLGCSSNDVSLALFEVVEGPAGYFAGETIIVKLKGDFMSTSVQRWDVGVFISEDGGSPNTNGGTCYSDYLHPVSADNNDLDLLSGVGPFYNGEVNEDISDTCGDIEQGNDATFITDWIIIQCQDTDGATLADVASCTIWSNSTSNGSINKPSCECQITTHPHQSTEMAYK